MTALASATFQPQRRVRQRITNESHRRIDECAHPQAGRDEAWIRLLHLQSIDERGDEDIADRQQPDRDHECRDRAAWPRDRERGRSRFPA